MPRFRTVAVAGLAVSAVLLTSGAAYAGDHDFHRHTHFGGGSFGGASEFSSMSWAYSSGHLSDFRLPLLMHSMLPERQRS